MIPPLRFAWLDGRFAVARLAPDARVPEWAAVGRFTAIVRTPDELSIVCADGAVPPEVQAERNWCAVRVVGTLDFALVGILARITRTLADAGVSVFAISTFDTDYVLVRAADRAKAEQALESSFPSCHARTAGM